MLNIRISPSRLEEYRSYIDEEYNGYITQDMVISSIKGEKAFTPQANFGTAFHAVIEKGVEAFPKGKNGTLIVLDGDMPESVILPRKAVNMAVEYRQEHPYMVHEVWQWLNLKYGEFLFTIPMKIDGLEGIKVYEVKTGTRPKVYEDYFKSVQWKLYLLGTEGSQSVTYDHFTYQEPNTKRKDWLVDRDTFIYEPYRTMKEEVGHWLISYANFCKTHDLLEYAINKK